MLEKLIRCTHCAETPDLSTFPLCKSCLKKLKQAPPLCQSCGNSFCDPVQGCARPWVSFPMIDSFRAAYLLSEPGYSILKSWKKIGGKAFDQRVLQFKHCTLQEIRADFVVPIPQDFSRHWKMRGSSAEKIAHRVQAETGFTLIHALKRTSRTQKRQAELSMQERFANSIRYEVKRELKGVLDGSRCILVDDFMTTGHTLKNAAQALKREGVSSVHIFCLGVRPFRVSEERNLFKSA